MSNKDILVIDENTVIHECDVAVSTKVRKDPSKAPAKDNLDADVSFYNKDNEWCAINCRELMKIIQSSGSTVDYKDVADELGTPPQEARSIIRTSPLLSAVVKEMEVYELEKVERALIETAQERYTMDAKGNEIHSAPAIRAAETLLTKKQTSQEELGYGAIVKHEVTAEDFATRMKRKPKKIIEVKDENE